MVTTQKLIDAIDRLANAVERLAIAMQAICELLKMLIDTIVENR